MDWGGIFTFLFQTYQGMAVLFLGTIIICIIACVIMERRTRKVYKNHEKTEDDWSFFEDDDEDETEGK